MGVEVRVHLGDGVLEGMGVRFDGGVGVSVSVGVSVGWDVGVAVFVNVIISGAENSEVFPSPSVAVAVILGPFSMTPLSKVNAPVGPAIVKPS